VILPKEPEKIIKVKQPGLIEEQLKSLMGTMPLEPTQADEANPPEWNQSSET
jgi:hypothetical protein